MYTSLSARTLKRKCDIRVCVKMFLVAHPHTGPFLTFSFLIT